MPAVFSGLPPSFRRRAVGLLALTAFALSACESSETPSGVTDGGGPATGTPGASDGAVYPFDAGFTLPGTNSGARGDGSVTPVVPPITASDTDLPCAMGTVLANSCWYCHGKTLSFGAPMSLLNAADFKANGKLTPTASVGALTLARMNDAANPMPPTYHPNQLSDADKKTLTDWVNAGMATRSADETACTLPNVPQPGNFDSTPTGGPADCEDYYELRGHGGTTVDDKTPFNVPANPADSGNMYECFYFDAPYDVESQGLWFAPLVDNSKVLHHWLLYGADDEVAVSGAPGTHGPCTAAQPGRWLIAGWAPGAPATSFPSDVGLKLSKKLVLEVHYYNNTGAPTQDRSGVKMCTAKKGKRPNLAGVHFTGSEGICVEPGQSREVSGMCSPDYGKGDANGDIHIVSVWPHMHVSATRMSMVINRANGTREVLHDEPFDFNNQLAYPKDVVLHRGDTMETRCFYTNKTNARIPFGERTQDEMCYGFVTAWPTGSLVTSGALINPINWVALPIQPALRCLDPTSIFNSCNGVADYPN
jgi:Copper type II ascorbate-dependent monooxygenase, C-terminal domain/Copper type II ascorbate-dependent monooxygenase, N-terminal domain